MEKIVTKDAKVFIDGAAVAESIDEIDDLIIRADWMREGRAMVSVSKSIMSDKRCRASARACACVCVDRYCANIH